MVSELRIAVSMSRARFMSIRLASFWAVLAESNSSTGTSWKAGSAMWRFRSSQAIFIASICWWYQSSLSSAAAGR